MSLATHAGTLSPEANIVSNARDVTTIERGVVEVASFPRATGVAKYPPKSNHLAIVANFACGHHAPAADRVPEVQSTVLKRGRVSGNATFVDLRDNEQEKCFVVSV